MRVLKSKPQNRKFFNEHGASLAKYNLIGLIGQTLSGLSLAYAVFALIIAQTAGTAPPTLSIILALVVGLFVELANRVLARPAIRPFVVKDMFADSAELANRHRILNRSYLVGLVAVALLSYLLSGVGSTYYAEDSSEGPQLTNIDSIKQAQQLQTDGISGQYAADTLTTAAPYRERLQAAKNRFRADSLALMKERTKYQACADKGNVWCKNKLTAYLATIDRSRAALADSTATIAREKAAALAGLLADRKTQLQQLEKTYSGEISIARNDNQTATAEHEAETSFQGLIFIILTIAGQTVFYYMVYLTLQVEAGAEIEYTLEPNEFWNLPGTVAEFMTGLSWRTERRARAALRTLYAPRKERQTELPYKSLFDNASSEAPAHTQETQQERSERRQRCDTSRARTRTQDVTQPQTQYEPQTQRKKRKGEVGSIEQCEHCDTDYTRKTTRQRFCSTDCRLNHHAEKNGGKRFDTILNGQK